MNPVELTEDQLKVMTASLNKTGSNFGELVTDGGESLSADSAFFSKELIGPTELLSSQLGLVGLTLLIIMLFELLPAALYMKLDLCSFSQKVPMHVYIPMHACFRASGSRAGHSKN